MIREIPHIATELDFSLRLELRGNRIPAGDHDLPRLQQLAARRVRDRVVLPELLHDDIQLFTECVGVSGAASAVESIFLSPLGLTSYHPRSCIRLDALRAHQASEIPAPPAQHGFVDVEPPAVKALRFDNQVQVGVLLVCVELCGAPHNCTPTNPTPTSTRSLRR